MRDIDTMLEIMRTMRDGDWPTGSVAKRDLDEEIVQAAVVDSEARKGLLDGIEDAKADGDEVGVNKLTALLHEADRHHQSLQLNLLIDVGLCIDGANENMNAVPSSLSIILSNKGYDLLAVFDKDEDSEETFRDMLDNGAPLAYTIHTVTQRHIVSIRGQWPGPYSGNRND